MNVAVRWFVARQTMFTSNEQMQRILAASTYSARYVTIYSQPCFLCPVDTNTNGWTLRIQRGTDGLAAQDQRVTVEFKDGAGGRVPFHVHYRRAHHLGVLPFDCILFMTYLEKRGLSSSHLHITMYICTSLMRNITLPFSHVNHLNLVQLCFPTLSDFILPDIATATALKGKAYDPCIPQLPEL